MCTRDCQACTCTLDQQPQLAAMQEAHLEDENLLALGVDLRVQQAHVLAQVANQRLLTFPEPPLGL